MLPTRLSFVAAATWLLAGCPSLRAFTCADASDCDLKAGGVCLSGSCAYPAADCASGLRWSTNAENEGACVEDDGADDVGSGSSGVSAGSEGTRGESDTATVPECGSRIRLRVDTAALAGTSVLESYPLLVTVEHAALVGADGLFFTDIEGDVLAFEVEAFDDDAGALRAWVRLPTWTAGQPIDLDLRFGDPSVAPLIDPTTTWAPWFVGVWHLGDALTGSANDQVLDSTANDERGRTKGSMTAESVVPAVVGSGFGFAGGDDAVEFDATFTGTLESFTISLWARVDADESEEAPLFEKVNGHHLYPRCRKRPEPDGGVQCQILNDGTVNLARADGSSMPRGEFRHVALVWHAEVGLLQVFVEGFVEDARMFEPGISEPGTQLPQIGRINEFNSLTGVLDEFRVADRALSAAWIAADARSQRDPQSVLSQVGDPEPAPCP